MHIHTIIIPILKFAIRFASSPATLTRISSPGISLVPLVFTGHHKSRVTPAGGNTDDKTAGCSQSE